MAVIREAIKFLQGPLVFDPWYQQAKEIKARVGDSFCGAGIDPMAMARMRKADQTGSFWLPRLTEAEKAQVILSNPSWHTTPEIADALRGMG